MKDVSTKELTEELCEREGINTFVIKPYSECTITTDGNTEKYSGPAVIVINQD